MLSICETQGIVQPDALGANGHRLYSDDTVYRSLAGKDSTKITLWSRRGNLFTDQFPHIVRACEGFPSDTLVDGEIVALDESGRRLPSTYYNITAQKHRRCYSMFLTVLVYRGRRLK